MAECLCECCNKLPEGQLTPRYVATKKCVMLICNHCIEKYITYPPETFIPDGDVEIC